MLPWERGRLARKAESAAGRGLDARDTLTLALSHEGSLLPYTFFAALNPVGNFSAHGIRRRSDNRF